MGFFSAIGNLFGNSTPADAASTPHVSTPASNINPEDLIKAAAAASTPQVSVPRPAQNSGGNCGGNWFNGIGRKNTGDSESLTVYSKRGTPLMLTLSNRKADGGEGRIYTLPMDGKEHVLIKVYKESILQDHQKLQVLRERLSDMLRLAEIGKQACFAWPRGGVFNQRGEVIGFAMNKCSGPSFLALSGGPASVRKTFPGWDRSHLVRTGIDFLKKLEYLSMNQVLVNDFNPSNFLVNERCEVSFIDCDSYQIPKRNGGRHVTHTYFPSHVAPELLKDKQLLSRPRTIHQVEFGAAITVFSLLMCGLHPYNYCDPSHKSACGTPDENLLKGRCPLGIGAGCKLPSGGWYNLWSWFTGDLKSSFIQTFRDGHGDVAKRVTLSQLREDLEKLLYVMNRYPERKELFPTAAKPRGDKPSRNGLSSGGGPNFIMNF